MDPLSYKVFAGESDPSKVGSYNLSSASAYTEAEQSNLILIPAWPNLLQIDVDSLEKLITAHKCIVAIYKAKRLFIHDISYTVSRSGNGYHIYIVTKEEFTNVDRPLWQAMLGSDPLRESLGHIMAHEGKDHTPTLFLEKLDQGRRPYGILFEEVIKPELAKQPKKPALLATQPEDEP